MTAAVDRSAWGALHPLHAISLAGALPLFLGGLLADLAYGASYQVQWTNFASWLIAGGLVFAGFALLWAVIALFRRKGRGRIGLLYALLLLGTFAFGFINALVHAKDAFAKMPGAVILSLVVTLLAAAATWVGFFRLRVGEHR